MMDITGFRRAPVIDRRPAIRSELGQRAWRRALDRLRTDMPREAAVEDGPSGFGQFVPADWSPSPTPLGLQAGLADITGAAARAPEDVQRQVLAEFLRTLKGGGDLSGGQAPVDISPEVIEMMLRNPGRL